MNTHHRFSGGEFDWFAKDSAGSIALFATAGSGFVPLSVLRIGEQHQEIVQAIECPKWGSPAVWDAYSELGLFVFDWELNEGPYLRVRTPAQPMPSELRQQVGLLPDLPKYPGLFMETERVRHDWHAA